MSNDRSRPSHPWGRVARRLWRYWLDPIFPIQRTFAAPGRYARYISDWGQYAHLPNAEPLRLGDSYPCLFDAGSATPYDPHYFYQSVWAMDRIARRGARHHMDVGSDVRFVSMLTTHLPVTFVDIRPLRAQVPHLTNVAGSLLALPFADGSADSLSCLHVAEHVGLGRYGDPLDPSGTRRACSELRRVLVPGGCLFFSLPVGRARVCFNAHRVHAPRQILSYFDGLELVEFSAIDDQGRFLTNIPPDKMENAEYGCGLFQFRRSRPPA
jgi:SAM-dependent methyltransferase